MCNVRAATPHSTRIVLWYLVTASLSDRRSANQHTCRGSQPESSAHAFLFPSCIFFLRAADAIISTHRAQREDQDAPFRKDHEELASRTNKKRGDPDALP